jgi:transposase, IS5 family
MILLRLRRQESDMARRQIGQEAFEFTRAERGRQAGLDELAAAIDWAAVERLLAGIYAAAKGEKAWPPLALFKALLLGIWHDLSDVRLAEALDDRASFRRFCGFSMTEPTPERTAFVRFRAELVRRRLEAKLLRAVVRQLEGKGLVVRTGTLVDATVIAAASRHDGEAAWCARAKLAPVKGYKAHVASDEAGGIVRKVAVTPANLHDCRGLDLVLPGRPGRVWADAAYDQVATRARIRQAGGTPRIPRRLNPRSRPALNAAKAAWNAAIRPVRAGIEKIFGTAKRSYGLGRARYLGLAKVSLQAHLTAVAYNLRRAAALVRPQCA